MAQTGAAIQWAWQCMWHAQHRSRLGTRKVQRHEPITLAAPCMHGGNTWQNPPHSMQQHETALACMIDLRLPSMLQTAAQD